LQDECHIHSKSFSAKFAFFIGYGPKAYMLHLRIEAGKLLLQQTQASISTIAISLGFNSLSAFDNAFKHSEGKRPSVWRGGGSREIKDFLRVN
jgi:AraC-like DNA-binding protein